MGSKKGTSKAKKEQAEEKGQVSYSDVRDANEMRTEMNAK